MHILGTEQDKGIIYHDGEFIGMAEDIQVDAQFDGSPEKMIGCDIGRCGDFTVCGEIKLSNAEVRVVWLYVYNMLRKEYLWHWMYRIKSVTLRRRLILQREKHGMRIGSKVKHDRIYQRLRRRFYGNNQ